MEGPDLERVIVLTPIDNDVRTDRWVKRPGAADEVHAALAGLKSLPAAWVGFFDELMKPDTLPCRVEELKLAGFRPRRYPRPGDTPTSLGPMVFKRGRYLVEVEGWQDSCLLDGLWGQDHDFDDLPGGNESLLDAYLEESGQRKRDLESPDQDAAPAFDCTWLVSLWLPSLDDAYQLVEINLWRLAPPNRGS